MPLPSSVENLKKIIAKMPAFSERGAERFIEWWWNRSSDDKNDFHKEWESFLKFKSCKQCLYFSENDLCEFCSNKKRDRSKVCIVSSPFTVPLIEKETEYKGLYFILGGEVINGNRVREVELVKKKIKTLLNWIKKGEIKEVIIATDFTSAGEATALFIKESLKGCPVVASRLAQGFHQGDSLSYSDPVTLKKAFSRRERWTEDNN